MITNNASFIERLIQVKQEEVARQHGENAYQFYASNPHPTRINIRARLLIVVSLILALVWLLV